MRAPSTAPVWANCADGLVLGACFRFWYSPVEAIFDGSVVNMFDVFVCLAVFLIGVTAWQTYSETTEDVDRDV